MKTIILFTMMFCIFISPAFAVDVTEMANLSAIISDTTYTLLNNISNGCINIVDVNNVILDCNGFSITDCHTCGSYDSCIFINDANTSSIINCNIEQTTGCFVIESYGVPSYGITLENLTIHDTYADSPSCNPPELVSISLYHGYNWTIKNLTLFISGYGIALVGNSYITMHDSFINGDYGGDDGFFILASSSKSLIYNNYFDAANGMGWIVNTTTHHYWNTTLQTGNRVFGNGSMIGGNYWFSYGIPYSCTDVDTDGICDDAFTLGAVTDYLPLSSQYIGAAPLGVMGQLLADTGSGIGGFFTAITNPLAYIMLILGIVAGALVVFYGVVTIIVRLI